MLIDFNAEEALFIYGRVKKELSILETAKGVKISKSDLKLYRDIISKLEEKCPSLKNLPI